jgi:hypothetical protein
MEWNQNRKTKSIESEKIKQIKEKEKVVGESDETTQRVR